MHHRGRGSGKTRQTGKPEVGHASTQQVLEERMIKEAISKVIAKEDLSQREMIEVMNQIMSGDRRHVHAVEATR